MKGVKGRIFKKLKQGRILRFDVSGRRVEEDDEKENCMPAPCAVKDSPRWKEKNLVDAGRAEIDISSFRRPDFSSSTLFDPELLSAFNRAVMDCKACVLEASGGEEPPPKLPRTKPEQEEQENQDPLMEFEERRPPGWMGSVILYTTSLRGIRKTFEDCNTIRFLLRSLKVMFYERDVSMHMEFRDELWEVLGGRAIPPRLFIRGRHIGGAEEVVALHEQGKLRPLLRGLPPDHSGGAVCDECGGMKFVVCPECSGSRKVFAGNEAGRCPRCNENGLTLCSLCS